MRIQHSTLALAALTAASLLAPHAAWAGNGDPLMGVSPWDFDPQNRAAVAVAIRNEEEGRFFGQGGSLGATGPNTTNITQILCGGPSGAQDGSTGSSSTATANDSCVIITDSEGASVDIDQHSTGDQSSEAKAKATTTGADEVAGVLGLKLQP